MIRILTVLGLYAVFSANVLCAGAPAMIDRHIFTPDNTASANEEAAPSASVPTAALEKELLFTGVLITPKGKHAIISENTKNEAKKQKQALKEGDQVKGMTIKEIGPNYVLLAAKESTVRLNLYKGAKPRPAPIAEPVKADVPQQIAQQGTPKSEVDPNVQASSPTTQGAPKEKEAPPSPFGGGPKPGQPVKNNPSTVKNPFTDLINNMPMNSGSRDGQSMLNLLPATNN